MSAKNVLLWSAPISRAAVEAALRGVEGVALTSVTKVEDAVAHLPQADALVIPVFNYTPELMAAIRAAPRLRFLQLLTIGFDRLAKDPPPNELTIATAGDALSPAVAEHAVTLILALGRRLHDSQANLAQAKWDGAHNTRMSSLDGKVVTIFGFGAIGREAAARLRPFGAHVIGISRSAQPSDVADEVLPPSRLDEALGRSDVVLIAAPLTEETRHAFNAARIARMKKGAILVNIARGPIVETQALIDALQSGQLGGAGLDVTDPEPLPADHPLWRAPNIILTPHIAASGSHTRLAKFAAENVAAFVRGETPKALLAL
jgi:phosphoglycerate dehydrogenase-like enzyme